MYRIGAWSPRCTLLSLRWNEIRPIQVRLNIHSFHTYGQQNILMNTIQSHTHSRIPSDGLTLDHFIDAANSSIPPRATKMDPVNDHPLTTPLNQQRFESIDDDIFEQQHIPKNIANKVRE
jgi:hypothetical protein